MQNTASSFGHAFLLWGNPLNSYNTWATIEYVADIKDGVNAFSYVYNGISGGFSGQYDIVSFEEKIQHYCEKEKRTLWIYPIKLTPKESIEFGDTLSTWIDKESPYKFFTNNCANGLYNLLKAAIDSIPESDAIVLSPQDLIALLERSKRLGRPFLLPTEKNFLEGKSLPQSSRIVPHKYSRLDLGFNFQEYGTMLFRFRPILHDESDHPYYYSSFSTFEVLAASAFLNSEGINFAELRFFRIYSNPISKILDLNISYMLELGLKNDCLNINGLCNDIELGIGKNFAVSENKSFGFLLRSDIYSKNFFNVKGSSDYYVGYRFFAKSFSIRNWRWGAFWENLHNTQNFSSTNINSAFWISMDLSERTNIFAESKLQNGNKKSISIMNRIFI